MTHSEEPQQIAHTIQKPTGTMPTKTRKREYPKKAEGTSPSFSKRPKGRRLCSVSGCTKWVQQGGACWRHGGRNIRAKCSYVDKEEGRCQNVVKRGGLCRVSTATTSSHLCIFCSLILMLCCHDRSTEHSTSNPAPALDARGQSSSNDRISVMFTLRAGQRNHAGSAVLQRVLQVLLRTGLHVMSSRRSGAGTNKRKEPLFPFGSNKEI